MNLLYLAMFEALACAVRTSSVNGASIDMSKWHGHCLLTLISAAMSSGDTLDVKVQDSPDGTTDWQDLSGVAFTQVTDAADAYETIAINAEENRGFIRIVGTIAGTSPSVAFGVSGAAIPSQTGTPIDMK